MFMWPTAFRSARLRELMAINSRLNLHTEQYGEDEEEENACTN